MISNKLLVFPLTLGFLFSTFSSASIKQNQSDIVNNSISNPLYTQVDNDGDKNLGFVTERNQFLRNLTTSEEEYQYYLNHEDGFVYPDTYHHASATNEFLSRKEVVYPNVNGEVVTANLYYIPYYAVINHPNIGIGLLLYKAILYTLENPDEYNEIHLSSFHYSIIAGVNLVENSDYYGSMKSMPDDVIDRDGFVRFSYLVLFAAKIGIHVYTISQLGGYSNYGTEIDPKEYYESHMDDDCIPSLGDKKVKDYLHYTTCDWVSYGSKAASDMYHLKSGAALHYLGNDGKSHDYTIFLSSSNLDGIDYNGVPGQKGAQTGIMVSNHKYLYLALSNFDKFVRKYCGKKEAANFRFDYYKELREQRRIITSSGYDSIEDSMMIYLGTNEDELFELYITPFDESIGSWSNNNPLSKYVEKMVDSKKAIGFYWINPKFSYDSTFSQVFVKRIIAAYKTSRNEIEVENSVFFTELPGFASKHFEELEVGKHLGTKVQKGYSVHQKDMIFEYYENDKKHITTIFNSMNFHAGAIFYQTNYTLVLNENEDVSMDVGNELIHQFTSH